MEEEGDPEPRIDGPRLPLYHALGPSSHTREFHLYFEETKQMTHPCPHRDDDPPPSYLLSGLGGRGKPSGADTGPKWERQEWCAHYKRTDFILYGGKKKKGKG